MFLFSIQHSAFSIFLPLAARHDDDPIKFITIAVIVLVIWAIQAIGKLAKRKPQDPPKPQPPRANMPPPLAATRLSQPKPRPTTHAPTPRPGVQAMRLPPLSQLHQQNRASPQRPPQPGQLRVAELLFANKLITLAQANRIRAELQRRQGRMPAPVQRIPTVKPGSTPATPRPVQTPAPLPSPVAQPRVASPPLKIPIPSRSTIARWIDVRTLRSQFILAEALQPPLALRRKPHLP